MSYNLLREKGDSVSIPQSGKELSEFTEKVKKLSAVLQWRAAVDLDIHAFYRLKSGKSDGHVGFYSKGKVNKSPYIHLDKDMGVGNIQGDNKEVITIGSLVDVDVILIASNIYRIFGFLSKDDNFSRYDGEVKIVTNNSDEIVVPLTTSTPGKWCAIALIDNSDPYCPIITNINEVCQSEPKIDDYLSRINN